MTGRDRDAPAWPVYAFGVLPLALGAVVDLPRLRAVGPTTGLGALSLAETAVAGAVLLAGARYPRRLLALLAPFAAFLTWGIASTAWAPPDVHGFQNLAAYLLLGFAVAGVGTLAARDDARAERAIEWAVRVVDVVALALVVASVARQGWALDAAGSRWLVQPRSVSLTGLAPLAWHLARWHRGRAWDLAPAGLWMAAIFVSLSRMATITALVLVAVAAVAHYRSRGRAASVHLSLAGVGVAAVLGAVLAVGPFRQRVFRGAAGTSTATALTSGTGAIDAGDRPLFWAHVARSALKAPVFGQGIGSSQAVMNERWPVVGHPHNDYLRVWHDLGFVGLAAFVTAFVTWGRALGRGRWRPAPDERAVAGQLEFAGLLALVGLALPMLTDNALVYSFVVGPVGVLVGAGLGAAAHADRARRRRRGAESGGTYGGASVGPSVASVEPRNPRDARWGWKPRYVIRRRRRSRS